MKVIVRNTLLALSAAATLLAMPVAQAQQGWARPVKIVSLVVTWGGAVNVRVSPELTGCQSASGYGASFATLYPDHAGRNQLYSILLAAYMAEKPVGIYLMDNTCKIGEVLLGGV